jgi:hypothetical protein
MPRPDISMRKIRDVLRLKFGEGLKPAPGERLARHPLHDDQRPCEASHGGWPALAAARGSRRRCQLQRPHRRPRSARSARTD